MSPLLICVLTMAVSSFSPRRTGRSGQYYEDTDSGGRSRVSCVGGEDYCMKEMRHLSVSSFSPWRTGRSERYYEHTDSRGRSQVSCVGDEDYCMKEMRHLSAAHGTVWTSPHQYIARILCSITKTRLDMEDNAKDEVEVFCYSGISRTVSSSVMPVIIFSMYFFIYWNICCP